MLKTISKIREKIKIMVFSLFMFIATPNHHANAMDVYVIANTTNTTKYLNYNEIEDIFTLKNKRWSDGSPIRVFVLPRDNVKTRLFTLKYLNMTPNRYYDLIESRESVGKGNITTIVDSEYEILIKVITTPGSVGYASDMIIVNANTGLVIIK